MQWAQYNQWLLDPGLRRGDDFSMNFTFFDTLLSRGASDINGSRKRRLMLQFPPFRCLIAEDLMCNNWQHHENHRQ